VEDLPDAQLRAISVHPEGVDLQRAQPLRVRRRGERQAERGHGER